MKTQEVVFEKDNKQIIKEGDRFFTRVFEGGESFESQDFNTLERAKLSLGIKPTTTENNRLIAEFMQFELFKNKYYELFQFGYMKTNGEWSDVFYPETLKFHKDWNWIMEVVRKIEDLSDEENNGEYFFEIYKFGVTIFSNGEYVNEILNTTGITKLEATYKAVVEFINYYNSK